MRVELRAASSAEPSRTRWLRAPAAVALAGLAVGSAALLGPVGVRLPAAVVAALLAPGALFFLGFDVITELPVRLGASLTGVIASWTGVATLGFSLHHALYGDARVSGVAVYVMLLVVYLLGSAVVLLGREKGSWVGSRSGIRLDEDPGLPPSRRDDIEHSPDH